MKSFHTYQKGTRNPVAVVQADLRNPKSIDNAERYVDSLLSQGYDVTQSYGGSEKWNVILTKEPKQ